MGRKKTVIETKSSRRDDILVEERNDSNAISSRRDDWWVNDHNKPQIFMWKEENNKLYRKFEFKNFSEAFAFMTRVAIEAEKMDHHPLWTNVYNQVEVWLSTHSAGDVVTDKDRQLAKKIDALIK
jgi:4a-hydroxytetrahydrobiopterin dehydratase